MNIHTKKPMLSLLAGFILASCVAPPPTLKIAATDRPLAHECKNVDPTTKPQPFTREFYRTASNSVISAAVRHSSIDRVPIDVGSTILAQMPPDQTFCMVYPESMKSVVNTVYDTVSSLGFSFQLSSPLSGEFVTVSEENSHGTLTDALLKREPSKPTVVWRETYFFHISENIEGGTDLRVFRDVWIKRKWEGKFTRFIREQSDGWNESWILLRVKVRLANNDFGIPAPDSGHKRGIRNPMSLESPTR